MRPVDAAVALLPALPAVALLAAAAASDLRRRTIPNAIPAALATAGAVVCLLEGGGVAMLWGIGAAGAVLALGLGLFLGDVLGGGDVKLAAAAALWIEPSSVPIFLILTSLLGAALAVGVAAARLRARLRAGRSAAVAWRAAMTAPVPYGVAIAASGSAVLLAGG